MILVCNQLKAVLIFREPSIGYLALVYLRVFPSQRGSQTGDVYKQREKTRALDPAVADDVSEKEYDSFPCIAVPALHRPLTSAASNTTLMQPTASALPEKEVARRDGAI